MLKKNDFEAVAFALLGRAKLCASRFLKNSDGTFAVMAALALPVILGVTGLAVDVGGWYIQRGQQQIAADAAAYAAAIELNNGANNDTIRDEARNDARKNGISDASYITVNHPPQHSASHNGDSNAVEVIISVPSNSFFSRMYHNSTSDVVASAVSSIAGVNNSGHACVLTLGTTGSNFSMAGSNTLNFNGCLLASNSTGNGSISFSGNNNITAQSIYSAGGITSAGSNNFNLDVPQTTNGAPIADPFASIGMPPSYTGSCDYNNSNYAGNTNVTLNPGTYCGGINASGNNNITLNPGTYYIKDGLLSTAGSTTITGNGVTLVFTGSSRGVSLAGNSSLSISAPTDNSEFFHGMALYGDPSDTRAAFSMGGTNGILVTGGVYFPNGGVSWAGRNGNGTSNCTQIVSKTVSIAGTTNLTDSQCGTLGRGQIPTSSTPNSLTLVE